MTSGSSVAIPRPSGEVWESKVNGLLPSPPTWTTATYILTPKLPNYWRRTPSAPIHPLTHWAAWCPNSRNLLLPFSVPPMCPTQYGWYVCNCTMCVVLQLCQPTNQPPLSLGGIHIFFFLCTVNHRHSPFITMSTISVLVQSGGEEERNKAMGKKSK